MELNEINHSRSLPKMFKTSNKKVGIWPEELVETRNVDPGEKLCKGKVPRPETDWDQTGEIAELESFMKVVKISKTKAKLWAQELVQNCNIDSIALLEHEVLSGNLESVFGSMKCPLKASSAELNFIISHFNRTLPVLRVSSAYDASQPMKFYCNGILISIGSPLEYKSRSCKTSIMKGEYLNAEHMLIKCVIKLARNIVDFEKELKIWRELKLAQQEGNQTGCVAMYSSNTTTMPYYLVLEYGGSSISTLLTPSTSPYIIKDVITKLLTAVSYLHQLNIVHLDINPESIVYNRDSFMVKLIDLDSARHIGEPYPVIDGQLKCRPHYACPEVALVTGELPLLFATVVMDYFSLGLVLWQLLNRIDKALLETASLGESGHPSLLSDQVALNQQFSDTLPGVREYRQLCSLKPNGRVGSLGRLISKLVSLSEEYTPEVVQSLSETSASMRNSNKPLSVKCDFSHSGVSEAVQLFMLAAEQGCATAQYNLGICYADGTGVTEDAAEAVRWYRLAAEQGYAAAQSKLGYCYEKGRGVTADATEAVHWYRLAAEQGDTNAQYGLGVCYENGRGLTADATEAVHWYRLAAEQGDTNAQYDLGVCYENGRGLTADATEAVHWYRLAAEQGDLYAQQKLGYCYEKGRGVTADATEAVHWYKLAAEQGDADAQCSLGYCYVSGTGVPQDSTESVRWFCLAADQGSAKGQCILGDFFMRGIVVTKDTTEAVRWYLLAAGQFLAAAQYNLGICYADGTGVTQDAIEAVRWFRLAAEQGYAKAQYNMGVCYGNDTVVPRDTTEAVRWYRLAAEQGQAEAQFNLGACYAAGSGAPRDDTEAVQWFRLAANQGHVTAQYFLGACFDEGTGVAKDAIEAVRWYRLAAEQGHADAQCSLGDCYKNGTGVAQEVTEAVQWYRLAAEQGYVEAQYNLGVCYQVGTGLSKDETEAVQWYRLAAEQGHAAAQNNLGFYYAQVL